MIISLCSSSASVWVRIEMVSAVVPGLSGSKEDEVGMFGKGSNAFFKVVLSCIRLACGVDHSRAVD